MWDAGFWVHGGTQKTRLISGVRQEREARLAARSPHPSAEPASPVAATPQTKNRSPMKSASTASNTPRWVGRMAGAGNGGAFACLVRAPRAAGGDGRQNRNPAGGPPFVGPRDPRAGSPCNCKEISRACAGAILGNTGLAAADRQKEPPPLPDQRTELSDADATLQLRRADRTMRVAAAADATEEIAGDDILEVEEVARQLAPSLPSVIVRGPLYLASAPPRASQPSFRALQSSHASQDSHHPSSLSPLALDAPAPRHAPLEGMPRLVPSAPRSRTRLVAVAGAFAVCVALAVGVAVTAFTRGAPKTNAAAPSDERPEEGLCAATENAAIEDAQDDVHPQPPGPPTAPTAPADSSQPAPLAIASASPAPPTPADKPALQTSVLRLPPSVSGVLIDGTPRRVTGGAIFVTCGKHRIKLPRHPARSIVIPCGRTASL